VISRVSVVPQPPIEVPLVVGEKIGRISWIG